MPAVTSVAVVGTRLRAALALARVPERRAADAAGERSDVFAEYLAGTRAPSSEVLAKVAELTGVGLEFFGDDHPIVGLQAALAECTDAVRELLALITPAQDVDSYPGGRIGWAIYRARMARNWTPATLAKLVGVSRSSIVAWETGRAQPRPRRWAQLLALFPDLGAIDSISSGRAVDDAEEEASRAAR